MTAHIKPFNAEAVLNLDHGALHAEVNRRLAFLIKDINDRPMDASGKATKARKLKIEITLTPVIEFDKQTETKRLQSISVEPSIDGTCPSVIGGKTDVRITKGGAVYNAALPQTFDQSPLFAEDDVA